MAIKHEALVGRSDSYKVNPTMIKIENGWNPRTDFSTPEDEELKNSIIENGVLVPIRIKKNDEGSFSLIDGERRLRATLKAIEEGNPIEAIPAIIERKQMNQIEAMFMALLTNTGKKLLPLEEAEAFNRLKNWGVKVEDIAKRMGVSVPQVYNRIKLIDLSPKAKEALADKKIGVVQAQEIVKNSKTIDEQNEKVDRVVNDKKQSKAKKIIKKTIPVNSIEDLLNEVIEEHKKAEGEYKIFLEGNIRAYCVVLGKDDPFDMNY